MALTFRLATSADLQAYIDLRATNKAALLAAFGSLVEHTLADLKAMIADGSLRVVLADDSGVVVGGNAFLLHPDKSWESLLTVTKPAFSPTQREAGFKGMLRWVANRLPGKTRIWGRVKIGSWLDLALSRIPGTTRAEEMIKQADGTEVPSGYAIHSGTADLVTGVF